MGSSAFDMLFNKSVPHILERIFFCLDHESFRNCLEVSNIWHELLTSEIYQKKIKAQYQKEITEDGWKLTATAGNVEPRSVHQSSTNVYGKRKCNWRPN